MLCPEDLKAKILASRPRLRSSGLVLVKSYYVIRHFWGNSGISGNNLKSYIVNHYLVLFS